MKRIYFVSAAIFTACLFCFQVVVAQKIMAIPRKYLNNPDGDVLSKSTSDVDDRNGWIVCSDRANNETYDKPGSTSISKTMNFMEKFYVTDEQGEFLHLYKYTEDVREGGSKKSLKKSAVDYGWAPKSNLLLWLRCMEDKTTHFGIKALPILSKDNYKSTADFVDDDGSLLLFNDPGLGSNQRSKNSIQMFQFLYVYKQDGNSLLLGKAYETSLYNVETDVIGWVNKKIVQVWNNRVCLEPNWDDDAVADRKNAKIKTSIFRSKDEALKWQTGARVDPVWDDDSYEKRRDAYWKRLPVLDFDRQNDVIRTGFVTDLYNERKQKEVDQADHERFEREMSEKIFEMRKINLVFVVDAGSGMSDYMSSIKYVVDKIKERQINYNSENKIRYGAVVYRDELDTGCPAGDLSFAKTPTLSSNSSDIFEFIEKEFSKSGCNNTSKAINKGLKAALRMLTSQSVTKDQTNIIVLLGGMKGKDNAEDELSKLIADTKSNLLCFQVVQGALSAESDKFPSYFRNILAKSSKRSSQVNRQGFAGIPDPKFREAGDNTFLLDYPVSSDLTGLVSFAEKGQLMPASNISDYIDSMMKFVEVDIERKITDLSTKVDGIGNKDVVLDASTMRYLASVSMDLKDGQELVRKYSGKMLQFFIPGYTTLKTNNLTTPVYKKVLFVSEEEYLDLRETMQKLSTSGTASDIREKIVNAYVSVLATYLGDKKAKEIINSIPPAKVMEYVTGLPPSNNELLNKHAIGDYKSSSKVDDDEIRRLQGYLSKKFNDIKNINGDSQYMLKLAWGAFYWIPEEFLP